MAHHFEFDARDRRICRNCGDVRGVDNDRDCPHPAIAALQPGAEILNTIFQKLSLMERETKAVSFAVKHITDALPTNLGTMTPSEDCKTEKNPKYRALMTALRLPPVNDVAILAEELEFKFTPMLEFIFNWTNKKESDSYFPFQNYLISTFGFRAVILDAGAGLADRLLFVSDIYSLRPRINDSAATLKWEGKGLQPQFRFRIQGRTDIGIFREGAISCTELLIAFEIKPNKEFSSGGNINRALREGVIQLIGMNADNKYSSPVVIVTSLGNKHFLLYLELGPEPQVDFKFFLKVVTSPSLAQLIQYSVRLLDRGCVTGRFASPPTPNDSPAEGSPTKTGAVDSDDDNGDYGDNVVLQSADSMDDDVDIESGSSAVLTSVKRLPLPLTAAVATTVFDDLLADSSMPDGIGDSNDLTTVVSAGNITK